MVKIAPSILSANFADLKADITAVEKAGADWLHIDVMDGSFVPNITMGPLVVEAIRPHSNLVFDVHLMINNPDMHLEAFAKAGADYITIHYEATKNPLETILKIKALGKKAGISIKPKTPLKTILPLLPYLDLVLIMSVEPGFGGQSFMEDQLLKVKELSKYKDRNFEISIDGGIDEKTAPLAKKAGVGVLVSGSYIFKNDIEKSIKALKGELI